jgi:ferredoxin--NADP+ reductase
MAVGSRRLGGMTLRVAVVGGGPAGIYAADHLVKSDPGVSVDILERLPAPFGLVRYGVAPDHPRIKEIVKALQRVLANPRVRLLGNVDLGPDIKLEELRTYYDAVVIATGAMADRPLGIEGENLLGSFGAADFVSWYDAHPDVPRTWPLTAKSVAVLGAGNVALDVARVLAKTADEMLTTDIPEHVHAGLRANRATDVHVFARRGPAYVKFSPLELRELAHSPNVDVVVHPEGSRSIGRAWSTSAATSRPRWSSTLWPTGSGASPPASRTGFTCTSSSSP